MMKFFSASSYLKSWSHWILLLSILQGLSSFQNVTKFQILPERILLAPRESFPFSTPFSAQLELPNSKLNQPWNTLAHTLIN